MLHAKETKIRSRRFGPFGPKKVALSKDIGPLFLKIVHRFKSFISFTFFDLISSPELPLDIVSLNTLRGARDLNFPSI